MEDTEKEIRPRRMRITLEGNAIIKGGSVFMYPGGAKILSAEPIDNNLEDQQKE